MLLLAAWALAQPPEPPVFRTSTRLVQVNVLVLDKQGRPVSGLFKDEFTVTDQGKRRSIAVFQEERADVSRPPRPKLPPNVFLNSVQPGAPGVVSAIVLDSLNTEWGDQAQARQQVLGFLDQIQPRDRVALLTLGREVRLLHDYTNDTQKLLRALRAWRGQREPGGVEETPGIAEDSGFHLPSMETGMLQAVRIRNTLRALEAVGQYLAGVPGRKNLIWVTAAFPMMSGGGGGRVNPFFARDFQLFTEEFDRLFRVLNNANVAVYPVDARGLSTNPGARINIETMQETAERTGGRAFFNRNDIGAAIRQVQDESAFSYTLGYYPDEAGGGREFRQIRVKVSRPGLTVRARRGYTAQPPAQEAKEVRRQQLQAAARNPFDSTGLVLAARVDWARDTDQVDARVVVDSEHLTLERSREGRWTGAVDVLLVQLDARGLELENTIDTVVLNLQENTYQTVRREGMVFNKRLPRKPGAETLKIVVRDDGSGLAGSLTVPLQSFQQASEKPPERLH